MKKFSLIAGLLAVGCGSSTPNRPIVSVDGSTDNADAAPVACLLPASLGAVSPTKVEAGSATSEGEPAPDNFFLFADLNADASPDVLLVDLYKGFGAFETGFPTAPTTIMITGAEVGYDTCGACILGLTDFTADGATGDPYMATSGLLELTSVSATKITGQITNLTLTHSKIDPDTLATTPHESGCGANLGSLAFDAVPMPEMAKPGKAPGGMRLALRRK